MLLEYNNAPLILLYNKNIIVLSYEKVVFVYNSSAATSTTHRQTSTPIPKKSTDSTTTRNLKLLQKQFDYKFIVRPNASFCSSKNLLLISFVLIPPSNFTEREVIRSTWAASQQLVGGGKNNTGWFRVVCVCLV